MAELKEITELEQAYHQLQKIQRQVSARFVIVDDVFAEQAPQVRLIQRDDVVEALAPDAADHALAVGILPGGFGGSLHLLDAQDLHHVRELLPVDLVVVAQQILRLGIVRERLQQLSRRPRGRWVIGDVHVEDSAAIVGEEDEHVQQIEGQRGYDEEVAGRRHVHVVREERPSGLRRSLVLALDHVLGHAGLGDLVSEQGDEDGEVRHRERMPSPGLDARAGARYRLQRPTRTGLEGLVQGLQ